MMVMKKLASWQQGGASNRRVKQPNLGDKSHVFQERDTCIRLKVPRTTSKTVRHDDYGRVLAGSSKTE